MKIAIIGIRGIPVVYSGYETFAESLSTDLVKKGYQVTVYCRAPYMKKTISSFHGVKLQILPTITKKNLDTIVHSFIATLHAIFITRPDKILYLGVGNGIFTGLPKLFGIKTLINVDGLDWRREKWSIGAKIFLRLSANFSSWFSNVTITDSLYMADYYRKNLRKETDYIPYAIKYNLKKLIKLSPIVLNKYQLKKHHYLVWVGRLVPDNHLHELIDVLRSLNYPIKLVVIGDDLYSSKYQRQIKKNCSHNIIFTGFIANDQCLALVKNALCYVETKRSSGTHPSLLEAMNLKTLIISNDNPANKNVLGAAGIFYQIKNPKTLKTAIGWLLKKMNKKLVLEKKQALESIIRQKYSWSSVVKQYIKALDKA